MITYLFGAGASAKCIPVVNEFHDIYQSILNVQLIHNGEIVKIEDDLMSGFPAILQSYYSTLRPHPTIDIFAKKLFLKGENEKLLQLKKWLIVFYNFVQYAKPIDERYTKFFASILQTKKSRNIIPEGINIITWNYDMQLEFAFSDFIQEEDIHLEWIHEALRIYPSPFYDYRGQNETNKFTITRLNGSAYLGYIEETTNQKAKVYDILFKPQVINIWKNSIVEKKTWAIDNNIMDSISQYEEIFNSDIQNKKSNRIYLDLTYCWEGTDTSFASHQRLGQAVNYTTDLIVIGYSFPYVNRDVDDDIIMNLYKIERIIIQDPMEDERFNFIENRIRKLLKYRKGKYFPKVTIQHRKDTSEFHLPQ